MAVATTPVQDVYAKAAHKVTQKKAVSVKAKAALPSKSKHLKTQRPALKQQAKPKPSKNGNASFYADGATGKPMSNGQRYNPEGCTVAHKTLPLNSFARVTLRDISAVVQIADRGPFVKGRVIDLSTHLAYSLDHDFRDKGLLSVDVKPVSDHVAKAYAAQHPTSVCGRHIHAYFKQLVLRQAAQKKKQQQDMAIKQAKARKLSPPKKTIVVAMNLRR